MIPALPLLVGLSLADEPPAQAAAPTPVEEAAAPQPALPAPFPAAGCGALDALSLGKLPFSMLSDRLRMNLPADAYTRGVPRDLMSAPVPEEATSLVFLESGSDRMGLVASETWQVGGADFEAAVHRVLTDLPEAGAPWIIEPLPLSDPGMKAMAWWPRQLVIEGEADVHALDVLYTDPTGAVIHAAWVLDAATASAYGLGCTGLAARFSASASPGTRALPLGTEDNNIPVSATRSVHIDIPADTALFAQPGPDFAVYYLLPLVPIDQQTSSMGLYVGASPQEISAGNRPEWKGKLLGEKGSWVVADEGGEGGLPPLYRMERIVALNDKKHEGPPLYVHVFIAAATLEERDALRAVAETMRWVKVRK